MPKSSLSRIIAVTLAPMAVGLGSPALAQTAFDSNPQFEQSEDFTINDEQIYNLTWGTGDGESACLTEPNTDPDWVLYNFTPSDNTFSIDDDGSVTVNVTDNVEGGCDNTVAAIFMDGDETTFGTIVINGTLDITAGYEAIRISDTIGATDQIGARSIELGPESEVSGNIYIGAGDAHSIRNSGQLSGTVTFSGNNGIENAGGTYSNFGTHNAAGDIDMLVDDQVALRVEAGRSNIVGTQINNEFLATINGSIILEGAPLPEMGDQVNGGEHTVSNQGTINGRVMFTGLAENTFNMRGGQIYFDGIEGDLDIPLISMGEYNEETAIDNDLDNDTFSMTGGVISPLALDDGIVIPDEADWLDVTLIATGGGNDVATISGGAIVGSETALDLGNGDDLLAISASALSTPLLVGEYFGGNGDDTLRLSTSDTENPLVLRGFVTATNLVPDTSPDAAEGDMVEETVQAPQVFSEFENFEVAGGTIQLAFEEDNLFDVGYDSLIVNNGATLRLGEFGSLAPTEGGIIDHFDTATAEIAGGLVFETATSIISTNPDATATLQDGGLFQFEALSVTNNVAAEGEDPVFETTVPLMGRGRYVDHSFYGDYGEGYTAADMETNDIRRLTLERGSSLQLAINSRTFAIDYGASEDDIFADTEVLVIQSPSIVVTGGEDDMGEDLPDTFVFMAEDLDGVNLIDNNAFFDFAYDVNDVDGRIEVSIIASRTPGFAEIVRQQGDEPGAAPVLDKLFNEAKDLGCSDTPDSTDPLCVIDQTIRGLSYTSDRNIARAVKGIEANRHSGLWHGMLANQEIVHGTVSLRSAVIRADLSSASPTQYAALPNAEARKTVAQTDMARESGVGLASSGLNAGNIWAANRFWIQGFGAIADRDESGSDLGHETTNAGVVLGYDRRIARTGLFGIFASYGNANIDSKGPDNEQIDLNTYLGGIYYSLFDRTSSMEVALAGGYSEMEGNRNPFGGGVASYDTDGWEASFRVAGDTNMKAMRLVITPNAALQYTFMQQSGYTETGSAPALLDVEDITMNSVETTLGVNVGLPARIGRIAALPKFKLAWQHEFLDETGSATASLINVPNASFNNEAVEVPSDRVTTGLGLDLASRGGTTFTLGYDFTLGSDYSSHAGAATLRVPF